MSEQQNQPILNEMPSVIMALFLLVVGIEGFIVLGEQGMLGNRYGLGMRYGLINQFGLFPAALNTQIETGVFSWFELKRYISFTFIHGSSVGTAISCALLLAMGKFVGSVFSNVATLIVFIGSAIGGALMYSLLVPNWACSVWDVYGCLRIVGRTCIFALGGLSRCGTAFAPGVFTHWISDWYSNCVCL